MDLRGCTVVQTFITLATVFIICNKGLACEAPSPQCFINSSGANLYTCEWRVPASMTNATFDLHFINADGNKWTAIIDERIIKDSMRVVRGESGEAALIRRRFVTQERLITKRSLYIWVRAHMGNYSFDSANTSVILSHTIKYAEPLNILKSWSTNGLRLSWNATEKTRAAVHVQFRRYTDTTAQWENRSMETNAKDDVCILYQVTVLDLQRDSAYWVRVRHKSTTAKNALWSDWSKIQMVPTEIENPPEITWQEIDKGTQRVLNLTWKAPSLAAAVGGVMYSVNDSVHESCHCRNKGRRQANATARTMYVSNSPVNISIIAVNQVGQSPAAVLKVPVKLTKDIKFLRCQTIRDLRPLTHQFHMYGHWARWNSACDHYDQLWVVRTCIELYTFQHGDPVRVKTLPARGKKEKPFAEMEDFVRYYYFEHKCIKGTLQTIKMCLFYKKEGAPRVKPQGLAYNKTHNLSKLWWKAIPVEDRRGFLLHYTVCITKTSPHDLHPNEECHNIAASNTEHPLDKLSPGFIYNISVAGVTKAGAGPKSILIINWSGGKVEERSGTIWNNAWTVLVVVLFIVFILILCCILIFKKFENRILPPVPVPVLHPTYCPEEMLEAKEEVHELTLHHQPPVPDITAQTPEDQTETPPWAEEVTDDDDSEEDSEHQRILGGPCDEPMISSGYKDQGLKPCENMEVSDGLGRRDGDSEVTLLVYMKTD